VSGALDASAPFWVRVGGGLESIPGGLRHGPADLDHPPPGGPWEPLFGPDGLAGWAPPGAPRALLRRAPEESARILRERRAYLLGRLGHKLRSAVLALQESARQAAFGQHQLLEQIYDQAQEVGRRAAALESVALDPKDEPRAVVIGAVLTLAAPEAASRIPAAAVVRVGETVLVDALTRTYEWMGGAGVKIQGERVGDWWRLSFGPSPNRQPLPIPEVGEPLVRTLVDSHLHGWLDSSDPGGPKIYLPAVVTAA